MQVPRICHEPSCHSPAVSSIALQPSIFASGLHTNGESVGVTKSDWPSSCKTSRDFTRIRTNDRFEVGCFNEPSCPQHGILIGLDATLPLHCHWKLLLMVLALPNQVLHSDRHSTQWTDCSFSISMGPQRALSPRINGRLGSALKPLAHPMVHCPVRLLHQRETMLQLLNPPGSLMCLFNPKLPQQMRPGIVQSEAAAANEARDSPS